MEKKELSTGRIYLKDGKWVVKVGKVCFPIRKEDTTDLIDPYSQGKETCFELVLINPMGRGIIITDVSQNKSNSVWCAKLWSTSEMVRNLQHYLETTPKEQIQKEWEETKSLDLPGPTVEEFLNPELYWKERCLAAELYIEESPCDHDIRVQQLEAYKAWREIVKKYESK
jgi:hypothetical protein